MWLAARHHIHKLSLPHSKHREVGGVDRAHVPVGLEDELGVEKQQGRSGQ